MGNIYQFEWEIRLIESIQKLIRSFPVLKGIFSFFTILGEPVTVVVLIAFIYWCIDKKAAIKTGINVLGAMATNCMIKNIFKRIRPYAANDSIECLKVPESGYDMNDMNKQGFSFPSGHATASTSTVTSLYLEKRYRKILSSGSIIVALVCISRFALGVHYPTDVLVGIIMGVLPVFIIDMLSRKLNKKTLYLIILAYSCLGIFHCRSNDYYSVIGLMIGFMSGDLFEEKHVGFRNTNNCFRMIVRVLIGGLAYAGILAGLKLPFANEILEAETLFAYLYRVFRYAISTFMIIGLYPKVFGYNILKFKENYADKTE